jgi:hypothetical protein
MAGIRRFAGVSLAVLSLASAACGQASSPPAGSDTIKPSYNAETGRLERITYDRNGDGRIDATTFMDGAVPVRAELDEDFDGRIDRWEHYATSGDDGSSKGAGSRVLEKVETSTRTDGAITRRELYESGVLRRVEEDADADGRMDKWETWEGEVLQAIALDTTGRGAPDRRLIYPAGGGAPRLEVDRTGSGTFVAEPPER